MEKERSDQIYLRNTSQQKVIVRKRRNSYTLFDRTVINYINNSSNTINSGHENDDGDDINNCRSLNCLESVIS